MCIEKLGKMQGLVLSVFTILNTNMISTNMIHSDTNMSMVHSDTNSDTNMSMVHSDTNMSMIHSDTNMSMVQ